MSCAIGGVRLLLFIFNFVFVLCGLGLVIPGVIINNEFENFANLKNEITQHVSLPSTSLIVIGAIIFIIAFFGCCGALRESHCMITTYAVLLLTVLIIQIAIGVIAFYGMKNIDDNVLEEPYKESFKNYWKDPQFIDFVQNNLKCCGVKSKDDYNQINGTIPSSCCPHDEMHKNEFCNSSSEIYSAGCLDKLMDFMKNSIKWIGGIAIGVAAVEFVGVVFALCLANSIKNAERRAYRV